jgi:hypothetical protein
MARSSGVPDGVAAVSAGVGLPDHLQLMQRDLAHLKLARFDVGLEQQPRLFAAP